VDNSNQPETLPLVVIACKIFQDLLDKFLPEDKKSNITYLDYGLHAVPKKLKDNVQDAIDSISNPSLVMLGYGLCGNGLNGIRAGKNVLLIPRADDCIAILLGSYEAYRHQFDAFPGTYYLSKGWLESGSNPLVEYNKYLPKYGPDTTMFLMDKQYQHYKRLVFVAHEMQDLDNYRPKAQDVASFCERWGMKYEEVLGSDQYVRRLVEVSSALDEANEDFIVVPPGGELRQAQFLR
jgi:hypothetical protein